MDKQTFIKEKLISCSESPDMFNLNRYLDYCKLYYNTKKVRGQTEAHHILPKSLFPEYQNPGENPWNIVHLPYRVHFLVHFMLAKAIGGTMWFALTKMNPENKNSRIYAIARKKCNKLHGKHMIGNVLTKTENDERKIISKEEYLTGNYIHPSSHYLSVWINGQLTRIEKDQFDESIHTFITQNKIVARLKNGDEKYFLVDKDEYNKNIELYETPILGKKLYEHKDTGKLRYLNNPDENWIENTKLKNMIVVKNNTGECIRIHKSEFDPKIHEYLASNKITCRNITTGETKNVPKEFYYSEENSEWVANNTGFITCRNINTGETKNIPKEFYYSEENSEWEYIHKGRTKSKESIEKRLQSLKNNGVSFKGKENPNAKTISIYDDNGILKYTTKGNFKCVCKDNNLPVNALTQSYKNSGQKIFTSNSNQQLSRLHNTFPNWKEFVGWYALIIEN